MRALTRRSFLSSLSFPLLAATRDKTQTLPSESLKYSDRATELALTRLTDPVHTSFLPASYNRPVSRRGNFLLHSSDRGGTQQIYRMDLKSGQMRQLTDAQGLDPLSVTLSGDERNCCYVDGRSVVLLSFATGKSREIYRIPDGAERTPGFSAAEDGLYATLVERKGDRYRLQLVDLARGAARTIVEATEEISHPVPRPKRAGVLYRRGGDLCLVNYDGEQNHHLKLTVGGLGMALWAPDGHAVHYLNLPEDRKRLNNIRELVPDTNEEQLVSSTSQFVSFGSNGDASVFVGASASKASPYILILVRSVKRELTLCEHRASDPAMVTPIFSPNSQRIFFQSDQHGKSAIYTMSVERLVEQTES